MNKRIVWMDKWQRMWHYSAYLRVSCRSLQRGHPRDRAREWFVPGRSGAVYGCRPGQLTTILNLGGRSGRGVQWSPGVDLVLCWREARRESVNSGRSTLLLLIWVHEYCVLNKWEEVETLIISVTKKPPPGSYIMNARGAVMSFIDLSPVTNMTALKCIDKHEII